MSNWISVKDRLPPAEEDVLLFAKAVLVEMGGEWGLTHIRRNKRVIGSLSDTENWYMLEYGSVDFNNITHWQPLPTAPKQEQDDAN